MKNTSKILATIFLLIMFSCEEEPQIIKPIPSGKDYTLKVTSSNQCFFTITLHYAPNFSLQTTSSGEFHCNEVQELIFNGLTPVVDYVAHSGDGDVTGQITLTKAVTQLSIEF